MSSPRFTQRGFTLVELMVVVAIIAILAGILFGMSSKPYGANPRSISDQLVSTMNLARLRAISTRRWHRVEVTGPDAATPSSVVLWQWSDFGMKVPAGTCVPGPPAVKCWEVVSSISLPRSTVVYGADPTVYAAAGSATVIKDSALDVEIAFRPDGSSTGGTLFLADSELTHPYRVVVYKATGSSYARETW